jgi:hypothetical protein
VPDDQTTFIGREQRDHQPRLSSREGVIASSSDNLFHPVSNNPTNTFRLPDIPPNPHSRALSPSDKI